MLNEWPIIKNKLIMQYVLIFIETLEIYSVYFYLICPE